MLFVLPEVWIKRIKCNVFESDNCILCSTCRNKASTDSRKLCQSKLSLMCVPILKKAADSIDWKVIIFFIPDMRNRKGLTNDLINVPSLMNASYLINAPLSWQVCIKRPSLTNAPCLINAPLPWKPHINWKQMYNTINQFICVLA